MSIPANSIIEKANFRAATPEEIQQAKGGFLWRCMSYPWTIACKVMGTLEIYRRGPNLLAWHKPYPQELIDRFSHWIGYNNEQLFMESMLSFRVDRHFLVNKKVVEAFFKHHRNNGIFTNGLSTAKILELLQQAFPEDKFTHEDFMMSCSKEKTTFYRSLLHSFLKAENIKDFAPIIQNTVNTTLKNWNEQCQQGKSLNITQENRLFTSSIITHLMFGTEESSKEIANSINFINAYIIKTVIKQVRDEDKKQLETALGVFNKAIKNILSQDQIPLFNQNKTLSSSQKKAMIFMLFFAGQETTASLLSYIIWQLALYPQIQTKIYNLTLNTNDSDYVQKEMESLFTRSINRFTPIYGVSRMIKEDTCLEYQLAGEEKVQKSILFKGQLVSARIITLAGQSLKTSSNYNDWFAFGSGCHRCPGDKLAVQEIMQLILSLVSKYEIKTEQTGEIPTAGLVTLQLSEDIFITITPRQI
jgi:cytochrome P450